MSGHPLVAIVGRPNVGKSTLYNRLVGGRTALVLDTPGLTRDRRYGDLDYFGRALRVVDTGGLDPTAADDVIGMGIHRQAHQALAECDAVLLVVDGVAGLSPVDQMVAKTLRSLGKPVVIAVNKIDNDQRLVHAHEFAALGFEHAVAIAAAHGRGIDELVETVLKVLDVAVPNQAAPTEIQEEQRETRLRLALVGKPNVGKSSLVNRILGAERSLVHSLPGTTTDPVDTEFSVGDKRYLLVDTAGIRRRIKVKEDIEKVSVSLALSQISRADVVALVIDASEGPSVQDARVANRAVEAGRSVFLVFNKMDLLVSGDDVARLRQQIVDELGFLHFAPTLEVSAKTGDGVLKLLACADRVFGQAKRRIPTAQLNQFFAEVCQTHPPPNKGAKRITIHYLTQGGVVPPTFLFWANLPRLIEPAYRRFLENQLRARYKFEGTPLRVVFKPKVGRPARDKPKGRRSSR